MRRSLALLCLAAMTLPLQAKTLHCVMKDSRGADVSWGFEKVNGDVLAEIYFEKNGTRTISQVGKRPPWQITFKDDMLTLRSLRDPDYVIVAETKLVQKETIERGDALLMRVLSGGTRELARGGCGFVLETPSAPAKRRKRPELGV